MNAITVQDNNAITTQFNSSFYNEWITYIDVKEKSRQTYERAIRQFRNWLDRNGITQPTRADILAFRDELKQTNKPSTVQAYIMAVRLFFSFLAQQGLYPNIADKIKGAKVTAEHKEDYLSVTQAQNLLKSVDRSTLQGKRDYAILCLMLTSGLRTVEIVRANREDISIVNDTPVLYIQGKGKEERTAYTKLEPHTEQAIQEYLKAYGSMRGSAPLFVSLANKNAGQRLTTRSVSRLAKEHLIDSGLNSPRITAHSLRHTTAVTNLRNGATLEETQQLMRHTNINTTMVYLNNLSREQNNSESRIGEVLFNV